MGGLLLATLLLSPHPSQAFPLVGLFLEGEPAQLGLGGEPFHDLRFETLTLARPAALAGSDEAWTILSIDAENTLSLRAGQWAGTRAVDRTLSLRTYLPLFQPTEGVSVGAFIAFQQLTSRLTVQNEGKELFRVSQSRTLPTVGVVTALPWGLQLAAGVDGLDAGAPRWLLEGRFKPHASTTLWVRHRDEGFRRTAHIPSGVASNVYSPGLHLPLDLQRTSLELGGSLHLSDFWLQGGWDAGQLRGFWAEAGARPWEGVEVKVGADSAPLHLVDSLVANGTGEVASLDLDLERTRAYAGADLRLGPRDGLRIRYVLSRLSADTFGDEIGTNAAQAFLHVDTDLGLLFQGEALLQVHQLGVGWSRDTLSGLRFSLGAQYLHGRVIASDLALDSFVMRRRLAQEQVESLGAHLLGVTGFIEVPIRSFHVGLAVGQLIPLGIDDGTGPAEPSDPTPSKPPPSRGPFDWVGDLVQTLQETSGGSRLMLQIRTDW